MDDQELADALVALKIGERHYLRKKMTYWYPTHLYPDQPMTASEFVRDWRVVGAVMERLPENITIRCYQDSGVYWAKTGDLPGYGRRYGDPDGFPRAINEAGVEALKHD